MVEGLQKIHEGALVAPKPFVASSEATLPPG